MNRQAVQTSLRSIRESGYNLEQFKWLECQEIVLRLLSPETRIFSRPATIDEANRLLKLSAYDDIDLMERQLLSTISLIRSRVGVLSLTECFKSLPMWAHYGAQARGYVLRLEGLDQKFAQDDTGSLNILKPVKYVEDLVGMTHDPATQDNLFLCKFQDWSYEREWRIISPLSVCTISADRRMHLRCVAPSIVTGIICGWNVSEKAIGLLAGDLSRTNPDLSMYRAVLDRGRVQLEDVA